MKKLTTKSNLKDILELVEVFNDSATPFTLKELVKALSDSCNLNQLAIDIEESRKE